MHVAANWQRCDLASRRGCESVSVFDRRSMYAAGRPSKRPGKLSILCLERVAVAVRMRGMAGHGCALHWGLCGRPFVRWIENVHAFFMLVAVVSSVLFLCESSSICECMYVIVFQMSDRRSSGRGRDLRDSREDRRRDESRYEHHLLSTSPPSWFPIHYVSQATARF